MCETLMQDMLKLSETCWVWDALNPVQLVYPDVMEQVECNGESMSFLP